ncbi:hypothetical protein LOAG_10369 [Loa loa]|uniref:RING-type domain-containing protein n=1 Tax=Loa loa TaxID=7209 RepID=A0A1S0TQ51_LOALO|nr:hypothetical protein LOAG_10369 [Loa loa]EFO18127.1 hypothetical protein LOAG_10369 [Loa loa]
MLNCPICLEADDGIVAFAALKCGHVFHRDCISSWLTIGKDTKICPVCRKSADNFLNLYFFSIPTICFSRNKKKFPTRQQSTRQYELRSGSRSHISSRSQISNTNSPYWLRTERS